VALLVAAALMTPLITPVLAQSPLPSFKVDPTQTSVSGLSSGAFMAVQFHTAYSASIMGVGVVAGGPYDCAFADISSLVDPVGDLVLADAGVQRCTNAEPVSPDGAQSLQKAKLFASFDRIDGVRHLATSRVYIFAGTKDRKVVPTVGAATYGYYRAAGVPATQMVYVHDVPAGHAFISPDATEDCNRTESPYINHCTVAGQPYDQARAILTQIYGQLNEPSPAQSGGTIAFDQSAFDDGGVLGPEGFLHVPRSCQEGAICRIHVVFHGCLQTTADIGDKFYTETGYNRWADANRIVVLYPQAPVDHPLNPDHCWDWWGYTGPDFDVRAGPQMRAVKNMIEHLVR
jgi:poly(3-hydroxybutyrate) depolymerase